MEISFLKGGGPRVGLASAVHNAPSEQKDVMKTPQYCFWKYTLTSAQRNTSHKAQVRPQARQPVTAA